MFIKRVLSIVALCACSLLGYYLGRIPGSPDVVGKVGDACVYVYETVQSMKTSTEAKADESIPEAKANEPTPAIDDQ